MTNLTIDIVERYCPPVWRDSPYLRSTVGVLFVLKLSFFSVITTGSWFQCGSIVETRVIRIRSFTLMSEIFGTAVTLQYIHVCRLHYEHQSCYRTPSHVH